MRALIFTFGFIYLNIGILKGQPCNVPAAPGTSCATAPVICDIGGYCSSTGASNPGPFPNGFCGNLENPSWIAFTAGSTTLDVTITASNCNLGFGLQAQIFSSPNCTSFTPVSNCWNPGFVTTGTLSATGLTVGSTYYILVDGFAGAQCDFDLTIANGTTGVSVTADAGTDIQLCGSGTVTLDGSGSSIGSNIVYSWTTSNGNIVSGATTLTPTVNAVGTYELLVTNTQFGCSSMDTVEVIAGNAITALANVTDSLTCTTMSLNLDGAGSSAGAGITYLWTSTNGNILSGANTLNPIINQAGDYTLTVTDSNSGCTAEASVSVIQNISTPNASATGGTIDCTNPSVLLGGSSTTSGTTYSWAGPGGFSSTSQNPTVTVSGTYTLTVTGTNGCTATATADVIEDVNAPDASATGGTIDCTNPTVQLMGSSTTPGVIYSWTGPSSFSSTSQNPTVNTAGIYILTVTGTNGCTTTATVDVIEDIVVPDASATGGTITCTINTVQLMGSSTTPGVTYSWAGPSGFSSTSQNPTVNVSGIYTLTVTGTNGCTTTATADVQDNSTAPNASATGGTIDCTNPVVQLGGNSTTPGVSFSWAGPSSFTSTQQNPSVNMAGTYTLTVTAPNGCTAMATADVLLDNNIPTITITGDTLNCVAASVQLTASSNTAGVSYSWTGPSGFTSTQQNPVVNVAGTYTLTITAPNGCTASATADVVDDNMPPNATALGGTIDCTNPTVQLSGNSTTPNVSYSWIGPNGFTSTQQNPSVSAAGTYTLTVTAPNGCTATATADVQDNSIVPNASTTGGIIDCGNPSVQLSGNSTSSGVSYSWTGPNGFTSTQQNPSVSIAGIYTLTVTAVNGCTATVTAEVTGNTTNPDISVSGGTITCTNPTIQLNGNSTTPGVSYSWTGPSGFSSTQQNPSVSVAGTYTLTVTAPNGCTAMATADVIDDSMPPNASATGGTIDCTNPTVQLGGNSTTPGASYSWTGPSGFSSTQQHPLVNVAGTYTLTVTGLNGCTTIATTDVLDDSTLPNAVATGGTISCTTPTIQLNGSSTTPGVSFSWTGPSGFSSTQQNPSVSVAGTYTLTVTAPNGCTATAMADVSGNANAPNISASGGIITCTNPTIQLNGNSTTSGVSYSWAGPSGFTSTQQNPTVNTAGTYTLTITAPNGCTATATADVIDDSMPPNITATGGTIDCMNLSVQLGGNSTTPGVSYSWTGPSGFTSSQQNPSISLAGIYTLTITGTNGCTASATANVIDDSMPPNVTALGGTIDCTNPSIQLNANSTTPNVSYSWTGPSGFTSTQQNPSVSVAGTYTLTITGTNGCTASATANVIDDSMSPNASASGGTIDCITTAIQLGGNSTTPGVSYSWAGSNGFSSTQQNPTVNVAGTYTLTVTGANGCATTATANVLDDNTIPNVSASGGTIDCNNLTVQLSGNSITAGVSYSWTGPSGFTSTQPNPSVNIAGTYTLTITGTNGCTATATTNVLDDSTPPDASASGGTIDCNNLTVQLSGNSTTTGVSYAWAGPGGFTSTQQNPTVNLSGAYTLTVTGTNGCTATATTNVLDDSTPPNASASGGTIDCTTPSIILNGNSTTLGVSYSWTGPSGFSSTQQNPSVNLAGTYTLTVTSTNGCTATADAIVNSNVTIPDVSATGGEINCTNNSIQLTSSSTTPGVSYSWTGPSNFSSTSQNPIVNIAGNYTVVVTGSSGCTNSAMVTVIDNTSPPNISSSGGVLDCITPTVQLMGGSTTLGVSYSWIGPSGFTSTQQNPVVNVAGTYTLTVTGTNGCTATATADVLDDTTLPNATASGGTIDCNNLTVQLNGNSTTLGVSYSWIGPSGFTSTLPNPSVNVAGTYTLTVTAPNGCTASATADIVDDSTAPNVTASGGTIDCNNPTIQLMGSSTTSGAGFSWTGPSGFISSQQNPSVNLAGTYTLTVTGTNGCTATATADVIDNSSPPNVTASGGTIDCNNPNILLSGNSTTPGVSYAWTGPSGFSSTQQNPTVNISGTYILTVTGSGGCFSVDSALVTGNFSIPNVSATGGTITCVSSNVQLAGASMTPGVTYSWSGPGGFVSTLQNPIVNTAGTYTLTVTASNGCTNTASAQVSQYASIPNIQATGGILNCNSANVHITGNSTTPNVTYSWTGPSGFSSTQQNPLVNTSGSYTLTVTAPNGCFSVASVLVEPVLIPDIQAQGDTINCVSPTAQLSGNSNTMGVTYAWTGPNNFSSTSQNPQVTVLGTYTLVITAPNGCTNSENVEVIEDITLPDLSTSNDTLNCNNNGQLFLTASSSTPGVSYAWTGPSGFSSTQQNPLVSLPGTYTLLITAPNSCMNSATVEIFSDFSVPNIQTSAGTLDCNNATITLNTNTTATGLTYFWTGPSGFSSTLQNPIISQAGSYTLTVTAANGCTNTAIAVVSSDFTPPGATATGGTITCQNFNIQILGTSNSPNATFEWSGPNGFSSTLQNPIVNMDGIYNLTVTGTNGCTSTAIAIVNENTSIPNVQTNGGLINCNSVTVQLTGTSATPGVTYAWTGPNGFNATIPNPVVDIPGTYTLNVLAPNGCINSQNAEVLIDTIPPNISASGGQLTCTNNNITLLGNSTTPGVSFFWTGPGGFSSFQQNPTVNTVGTYTLTVTGSNGCFSTTDVEVSSNAAVPDIQATGGALTCFNSTVQLAGNSATPGVTFIWTGPNNFSSNQQNPIVNVAGIYTLTVIASNNCSATASVVVDEATMPVVQATGGNINCNNPTIQLTATSSLPAISYVWTGPNGFSSSLQNPVVDLEGTYTLIVTADNGCVGTAMAIVNGNTIVPDISAIGDTISCVSFTVQLTGISNTPGVNFMWSGPNGFSSTQQNPIVSSPGIYTLTVTAPNNCSSTATVEVDQSIDIPNIMASGDTITCNNPSVLLSGNSTTPNVSYFWTGPSGFSSNLANPMVNIAGNYTLLVTAMNGCTASMNAAVLLNMDTPNAEATDGELTCLNNEIELTGNSATPNVAYFWTGPNGFTSNLQNPLVTASGNYILTITASNGCTNTASALVTENNDLPNANAIGNVIDCINQTVQINANSTTPSVNYGWVGPSGFVSNDQNPVVSQDGTYTLTVTAPNGCSALAMAEVTIDTLLPEVQATGGVLTCDNNSIQLTANSTTPNVSWSWQSFNGFSSILQNPVVSQTGTYTLTVTAPNGCSNSIAVEVSTDANLPDVQIDGSDLTCLEDSIQIFGNSTTPNVIFDWTGPNGFSATTASPFVSLPGDYQLVVTAPNGCAAQSSITINNPIIPGVEAQGGILDCNNAQINLLGNSTTPNVNYAWTGPNGFNSPEQNPVISIAGNYLLTVTGTNGCTNSVEVVVTSSTDLPDIQATGGAITCDSSIVVLSGNSSTLGVSYLWIGPNGFNSTEQNPTTTTPGSYELVVTAPNGCTTIATVNVNDNTNIPDLVVNGGTLTCTDSIITLSAISSTNDVTYEWVGPNGFTSNEQNPVVENPGDYQVTISAPNGCTNTSTAFVNEDLNTPNITANGGVLNCIIDSIQLFGASTTAGVNYSWTGPNGFFSIESSPFVALAGFYELQVIGQNGCLASTEVEVLSDINLPDAQASGGTLTCTTSNIIISGSSSEPNANFSWTGPGGFTFDGQNPQVEQIGTYILTVTGANGCTATATAIVDSSTDVPNVMATAVGALDCNNPSVQLNGNSTTSDVSYSWTGPGGFNTNNQNPSVNQAGTYTLTVTATNGCTASSSVNVIQIGVPEVVATGGVLTCSEPQIQLSATSNQDSVTFFWTGPNSFTSTEANPLIDAAGNYTVVVSNSDACTSSTTVVVTENTVEPELEVIGGILDCDIDSIALIGISSTSGLTYFWTGPNNFSSIEPSPFVNAGGEYELIVTAPNGCTNSAIATVEENLVLPDVQIEGETLNCSDTIVNLLATTSANGALYNWTGPNAFSANIPNPSVFVPGIYALTVTANNGCTGTASFEVMEDIETPDIDIIGGLITCNTPVIQLQGVSTTPGVSFYWEGDNGFTSSMQNPFINQADIYTLTVTAPNGCTSSDVVTIEEDVEVPILTVNIGNINCDTGSIELNATSSMPDIEWLWTGPNGFNSNMQNPVVNTAGVYELAATPPNGCSATEQITIDPGIGIPDILAFGDTLSCIITTVQLEGISTTAGVTFEWVGPDGFSSNEAMPFVSTAGTYELIVTAPNGCQADTTIQVIANDNAPTVDAGVAQHIDCENRQVELQGSISNATGGLSINWFSHDGSILSNPIFSSLTVDAAGTYYLEAIDLSSGCIGIDSVVVTEDPDFLKDVHFSALSGCERDEPGQLIIESLEGGLSPFLYSVDGSIFSEQTTYQGLEVGTHLLIVQDAAGCEIDRFFSIPQPDDYLLETSPDVSIEFGETATIEAITNIPADHIAEMYWTPYVEIDCRECLETTVAPKGTVTYTFTIITKNGCELHQNVTVFVSERFPVFIPNVFSPNNDGINDRFYIFGDDAIAEIEDFKIFNRWGSLVFEQQHFQPNDPAFGWDGNFGNSQLDEGVFTYFAIVRFKEGLTQLYKGDITLIR